MINSNIFLPNYEIERSYKNKIAVGIDEAGRGPLAGPVVACVVYLESEFFNSEIYKEINDSKKISKKKRQIIFDYLINNVKYGVGIVDAKKIDEINILNATKLAMKKSYEDFIKKYDIWPQIILVDGNFIPFDKVDKILEILSIVKGDQKSLSISAASIIAKETRDKIMIKLSESFPEYLWHKNSAYGTKEHIEKIKNIGICKYHRKSFEPIKSIVKNENNS